MAKLQTVKIEKDGITGEVTKESLKAWERNGWTAVDDGSSNQPESSGDDTVVVTDPYDKEEE